MNYAADRTGADAFVESLVQSGTFTAEAARRLRTAYAATSHPFDTVVIELGLMREEALAQALAAHFRTEYVDAPDKTANMMTCEALGLEFLTSRAVVPAGEDETGRPVFLVADPFDGETLDMVSYHVDRPIAVQTATRGAINTFLASIARNADAPLEDHTEVSSASDSDLERLKDFARQAPIVRLVARIVQFAVDGNATDIHIEPAVNEIRIRVRVDGMLKVAETAPLSQLPGIATRIKLLAGLDIAERRLPQDGRMRVAVRGQEIDLRVSVVPTIHGETMVLRILDRSVVALDLATLGYDPASSTQLEEIARCQNGIVLVTGPTGSGKTTTLYALLSLLSNSSVKIFTVEDPVEYRMDGVTQLQIQPSIDLTFARALRSVLRQDPDIILVGEIRDRETAEIAIQAALTGHLVLSTLHTNSAVGAVTRLRDMGIPDYLIGATVRGMVGQRLLRRTCSCRSPDPSSVCPKCNGTGYHGRTATFEIARVSERLGRDISSGAPETALLDTLVAGGMTPIQIHAEHLVSSGLTDRAEMMRVIQLDGTAGP
ncbi:GspE/PulE family protein [Oricola cellulosilytica]|uniref:Type II/IV secretion system protein n=1 Tax=Oricola cellulosilytica TaxID=1429082 RepID=A0A4V2MPA4_9HYPH|nr:GspE/PulE family protein [Oricola cellulosilytica]TCD16662.1 type II/IV secretion system protein [Oricola cellulosilytica]